MNIVHKQGNWRWDSHGKWWFQRRTWWHRIRSFRSPSHSSQGFRAKCSRIYGGMWNKMWRKRRIFQSQSPNPQQIRRIGRAQPWWQRQQLARCAWFLFTAKSDLANVCSNFYAMRLWSQVINLHNVHYLVRSASKNSYPRWIFLHLDQWRSLADDDPVLYPWFAHQSPAMVCYDVVMVYLSCGLSKKIQDIYLTASSHPSSEYEWSIDSYYCYCFG